MKCVIVGVFDVPGSTSIPINKALNSRGVDTVQFNYRELAAKYGWGRTNELLVSNIVDYEPDFLLICKGNGITQDTILECRKHTKVILWYMDAMKTAKSVRAADIASASDVCCVTSSDTFSYFLTVNRNTHLVLDGIDPGVYYPRDGAKKAYDVSFIGSRNDRREKFIDTLRSAGIDVHVFGNGWGGGSMNHHPVIDDGFRKVVHSSKINLNIKHFDDLTGISNRVLRIMGSGGFLLSEYIDDLSYWFSGLDHLTFRDVGEAIEIIRSSIYDDAAGDFRRSIECNAANIVHTKYGWGDTIDSLLHYYKEIG